MENTASEYVHIAHVTACTCVILQNIHFVTKHEVNSENLGREKAQVAHRIPNKRLVIRLLLLLLPVGCLARYPFIQAGVLAFAMILHAKYMQTNAVESIVTWRSGCTEKSKAKSAYLLGYQYVDQGL